MPLAYTSTLLRETRERRSLPLDAVARRARLSARQLRNIERGISVPRADTLARLAAALDVPVTDFFAVARPRRAGR